MNAPQNILTQCPAGHPLQVAAADAGKLLACPVCGTNFTVGGGAADAVSLRYADARSPGPITRPTYTGWLLGLWLVGTGGVTILSAISIQFMPSFPMRSNVMTQSGGTMTM